MTTAFAGMEVSAACPAEAGLRVPAGLDESEARKWEYFVWDNPRGYYQQSVRWAWVKEGEGWRARLITWVVGDSLQGGFLLLLKDTTLGRIGLVKKGPVLAHEDVGSIRVALEKVLTTAKLEKLRALIVQPPDESRIVLSELAEVGFCRHPIRGIVAATLVTSLEGGPEGIRERIGRTARREAREAIRRGVSIKEGSREDLPTFFELMCHTCRRQGVAPSPSSVGAFYRRWDAFGPNIRLLLAQVQGTPVAGLLLLRFGTRCTFEKKGWNELHADAYPNTLLNVDAMTRAAEWGCKVVDFGAMDRSLAERMLRGEAVHEELASTRHAFNYRLGARPVLQPPAQVLVRPTWLDSLMDYCLARPRLARSLERWFGQ